MLKSLYNIGKVVKDHYPEYFFPWSNPFSRNESDANVIYFNINDGKLDDNIQLEKFNKSKVDKYLYRKVQGANGTNLVPTFLLITNSNKEKYEENINKLIKKISACSKNYKHCFINQEIISIIKLKLIDYHNNLSFKDNYLFTLKIDNKYFGEFDKYKQLFIDEAYNKYYKDSSSTNKLCAVTYKQSDEVWGRVDTLGFTVNDLPFSRNGFNAKNSYKMFPVSPEAVKILEGSKRYILEKFSKNFFGLKYFILPHFIDNNNSKLIDEIFIEFVKKTDLQNSTLATEGNSIIYNETIIKEIIEDEKLSKNNIYYDIFFYEPNNAQFLIKLHLSDILPSRFKKVFVVKNSIETNYKLLNKITIPKKGKELEREVLYYISFEKIKDFFAQKIKNDTIFHPYFFKILEAVFYGNYLNEHVILKAFMTQIIKAFKNRNTNRYLFSQTVKHSLTLYYFFYQLNLFKNRIYMNTTEENPVELNLQGFIALHSDFFNSEFKKSVFMLGCLTQILLKKQYAKLKSEPFTKHLNNLNIDEKTIQKILPKLVNKLKEYEVYHFYQELESEIAKGLITKTNLPKVEISYTFTLGMIMQDAFNEAFYNKDKNNN